MVYKEENDVVKKYLKTKPHWIVRNGLTTIIGLILIGAIVTSNIPTESSELFQIKLSPEDTLVYEVNTAHDIYLTKRIKENKEMVIKNGPIASYIETPSYRDLQRYNQSLNTSEGKQNAKSLFDELIDLRQEILRAPVDGIVYYSLEHPSSIHLVTDRTTLSGMIPNRSTLASTIRNDNEINLSIIGSSTKVGNITILTHELRNEVINISFTVSRTLEFNEALNKTINVALVRKISLLESIIEQL